MSKFFTNFDPSKPENIVNELQRILALPSRPPINCDRLPGSKLYAPETQALVEVETERYSRKNTACRCQELFPGRPCIHTFQPMQAWMLRELRRMKGGIGLAGVGSGKCVGQDSYVFDLNTGRRRCVTELGTVQVGSLNGRSLIESKAAQIFASGMKACSKLTLADGTFVNASVDHPVLTQYGWQPIAALRVGNLVAVANRVPDPEQYLDVSDDEVKMLGLLYADGAFTGRTIKFTDENPSTISEVMGLSKKLFEGFAEHKTISKARDLSILGAVKFKARWGLTELSKHKRLHPDLWGLSQRHIALFLNRFLACDGYVNDSSVETCLASERLIDDLQFLFLRIGIRARKRFKLTHIGKKSFDSWRLTVSGEDLTRFFETVGYPIGVEARYRRLQANRAPTRNTNVDVVPVGYAEVHEIMDELGLRADRWGGGERGKIRQFLQYTKGQQLSRRKFIQFCELWGYRGKYACFASEDVRWEKVKTVEDTGVQPVYDLSVPDTHNFLVNAGMVVHNSLLSILAPLAVPNCKLAVLLAKPDQRIHYRNTYIMAREHFRVPSFVSDEGGVGKDFVIKDRPVIHFVPYSKLSQPKSTDLLESLKPDLIIADEAHCLAHKESSRTARFFRYIAAHVDTIRFCGWSGTLADKSIEALSNLSAFALGDESPLPTIPDEISAWAQVLDPLPRPDKTSQTAKTLRKAFGYQPRDGLRKRILETPGIVSTKASSVDASMAIHERKAPELPEEVKKALAQVRGEWVRPDGEEMVEATEVARCVREVASGFFNKWFFPHGEAPELIHEWFEARKEYNKELREKLKRPAVHLDSPMLCFNAAKRFYQKPAYPGDLPTWKCEAWPRWNEIKDLVYHETREVWIDDFLARDAAEWAAQHKGIVWYQSRAFGKRVAELAGLPQHGGGEHAEENILAEDGTRSVIASIKAHGQGRDGLQLKFHEQLFAELPSSGGIWEQALGRLHRKGFAFDSVDSWVYLHVSELKDALRKAFEEAWFSYGMTGNVQKLLVSDMDIDL